MYHPAKAIKVFRPGSDDVKGDHSTQALVEMWDKNVFTFLVHPSVVSDIREGSVVLVNYRKQSPTSPHAHTITKVLEGDVAEDTWSTYQDEYDRKKKPQTPPKTEKKKPDPHYFG